MKKLTYAILALLIGTQAFGQYDPDALAVLNAMSDKYQKMAAFAADFTQELNNESADINETISGEIIVEKDKYLLKVAGQEIYNNGENVYSYSPELKEVTISPFEPEEEEITMGNIYNLYKEGFKYALVSVNQVGDRIIELDPETRDKSYYKIRMIIDKNDELKKFTVFERSGNKYIYTIDTFTTKDDIPDSFFVFDTGANPDVEVIDFR